MEIRFPSLDFPFLAVLLNVSSTSEVAEPMTRRATLASFEVMSERIFLSVSKLAQGISFQPSHLRCLKICTQRAETHLAGATQRILRIKSFLFYNL